MMFQHVGHVTLVALSLALALLSDSVFAGIESKSASLACVYTFIGDGDCDPVNNNYYCGYDGGDCCECTCVDADFECGDNGGFSCLDPSVLCVDDDDVTAPWSVCIDKYIGDAYCDRENNVEECDYDGGDCCDCTCVSNPSYTCGDGGFACADPRAPCFKDDMSLSYSYRYSCLDDYIEDGDCDIENNNEYCGYDGGDCCECTCGSDLEYACGFYNPFDCVDPEAPCVNDAVESGIKAGAEDSHEYDCGKYKKNC